MKRREHASNGTTCKWRKNICPKVMIVFWCGFVFSSLWDREGNLGAGDRRVYSNRAKERIAGIKTSHYEDDDVDLQSCTFWELRCLVLYDDKADDEDNWSEKYGPESFPIAVKAMRSLATINLQRITIYSFWSNMINPLTGHRMFRIGVLLVRIVD